MSEPEKCVYAAYMLACCARIGAGDFVAVDIRRASLLFRFVSLFEPSPAFIELAAVEQNSDALYCKALRIYTLDRLRRTAAMEAAPPGTSVQPPPAPLLAALIDLFLLAADKGNVCGQLAAGLLLYLAGAVREAIKYLQMAAAEQKESDALFCLGIIFYDGVGVECNMPLAMDYFIKSMKQGNIAAKRNIDVMTLYAKLRNMPEWPRTGSGRGVEEAGNGGGSGFESQGLPRLSQALAEGGGSSSATREEHGDSVRVPLCGDTEAPPGGREGEDSEGNEADGDAFVVADLEEGDDDAEQDENELPPLLVLVDDLEHVDRRLTRAPIAFLSDTDSDREDLKCVSIIDASAGDLEREARMSCRGYYQSRG
jgi:hypothetical protein